jgi:tetratricopeptide (TPR) repeat protein
MGVHFHRGSMLLRQGRHEQAVEEFGLELAEDPDHALAHAMMAEALCELKRFKEAGEEAKRAVALEPDADWAHVAMARVLWKRQYVREAQGAAEEAVRLDPGEPANHVLLGYIHVDCKRWKEALACAERALALDAQNTDAANLRATSLVKLGRRKEADDTLDGALNRDPEDAWTHANRGWALLERGQPKEAMEHFREALRLNPQMEWARVGIVEALKARTIIYRPFLAYFLWIGKLREGAAWAVLIGLFVLYHVLRSLAASNPSWAPYVQPILTVYIVFVISTWLAHPLFNLMLRLHPFGKLALSREQIVASNWIGAAFFLALASLAAYFFCPAKVGAANLPVSALGLTLAICFGFILFPLTGIFACPEGWPRRVMSLLTLVLVALGATHVSLMILQPSGKIWFHVYDTSLWVFVLGCALSTWLINALGMVRVKR